MASASSRLSIASWNSAIRQSVNQGQPHKALVLFRQLKQNPHNPHPNNLTFPFIAKACAKLSNLKLAQTIHAHVSKTPYTSNVHVHTAMVDMYVKCNSLESALRLFDEIPDRDVCSYNAVIAGFAKTGNFDKVLLLFNRMRVDGILPDAVTLMGLTQLVSGTKDSRLLGGVHCLGMRLGLGNDVSVANTWISGYAKCGDLWGAERVFDGVGLQRLSVVSWNALIAGCAYFEDWRKGMEVYVRMVRGGFMPDLSTVLNLLSSFASPECLCQGMMVHGHGVKCGCDSDIALRNTLISMYSKCGDISSARCVFNSMDERSRVTWTVMIGGYSEKGDLDEVLSLFHGMDEEPDLVTVLHLIAGCGKVGALEVGKWVDSYTVSNGLKSNLMVCNALLDMYAKCGSVGDAQKLFGTMKDKNVVSWTAMISGFALNGKFQASLDHFNQMLKTGIRPNHITFLAVLQACTHAGLVEKGLDFFDMMTQTYEINPTLDHYACMVDLLGRRGKLKEALTLITEMPLKPDAGIWGALLSACKIHHNLEIGEFAARQLILLEPRAAAPYVEMANIYAFAKDWDGVAGMRVKMKSRGVVKSPGESVVIVDGKCCTFTVEDKRWWEGSGVFETLDSLVLQLKDVTDYSFDLEEVVL